MELSGCAYDARRLRGWATNAPALRPLTHLCSRRIRHHCVASHANQHGKCSGIVHSHVRQHPAINASWLGDKIRRYKHVHVGIAVAIEDGLIVPVVRFADQKTLPQIAAESKELAGKAKGKKLQPNEFTGNTFTISNLGMMDIDEFTAIINPPDSAIMAVGRIKETVVRKGEGFGVSNFMKVTLSCDHRSVDGASGAAFLQTFKKYLENPITMLL